MGKFLDQTKNFVLDILFPIRCLGCEKEGTWICKKCFQKIEYLEHQLCPACLRPTPFGMFCGRHQRNNALSGVITATHFNNPLIERAIHSFKYFGCQDLKRPLGKIISKVLEDHFSVLNDAYLVPVPLFRRRLRFRGFNQALLICEEIKNSLGLEIVANVLVRIKNTPSQTKLSRQERRRNVKNAFRCGVPEKVKNKKIILVDDVCTTHTTLSECARVLKGAGAAQVWAATIARG